MPRPTLGAVAFVVLLAGCSPNGNREPTAAPTQVAARVNDGEITVHQVNAVLLRQGLGRPDDDGVAARAVLERLIDQELAVQKAREQDVDRDPALMQEVEAARRDIVARAWAERAAQGAAAPGDEELRRHFDDNAALYARRQAFNLQEIVVEASPAQVQALRDRLGANARVADLMQGLREAGLRWRSQPSVRTAEQLPAPALQALQSLRDGQALLSTTPRGALVLVRVSSREQPLDFDAARPAIEQRLRSERRRQIVEQDLKALRDAARIEYLGPFAAPASASAAAAPDATPKSTP